MMVLFLYSMQKNILQQPVQVLKLVASIMYLLMGIFILIVPSILDGLKLGAALNYTLAGLLIVYGTFRLVRVVGELRATDEDTL